ncbi:MAG: hypothetical protein MO847_08640 [Candidatus Protistobacter heckmanni]|nr:hypothetical protein [Candidatus Protistobacter heckmanni]
MTTPPSPPPPNRAAGSPQSGRARRSPLPVLAAVCAGLLLAAALAAGLALLAAPLWSNDRPLALHYQGRWYFPQWRDYAEREFGGELDAPADYLDPLIRKALESDGNWALYAPLPYAADTVDYFSGAPDPAPPSERHRLGTDAEGRDRLALAVARWRERAGRWLPWCLAGVAALIFLGVLAGLVLVHGMGRGARPMLAGRALGWRRDQVWRRHLLPLLLARLAGAAPEPRSGSAQQFRAPVTDRWTAPPDKPAQRPAPPLPIAPVLLEAKGPGLHLTLREGEITALASAGPGEMALALTGLRRMRALEVALCGRPLRAWPGRELRAGLQLVPGDAADSLPAHSRVEALLAECLLLHRPGLSEAQAQRLCLQALREVGLDKTALARLPAELDAAQRLRVALARALLLRPQVLILEGFPECLPEGPQHLHFGHLLAELQQRHNLACLLLGLPDKPRFPHPKPGIKPA